MAMLKIIGGAFAAAAVKRAIDLAEKHGPELLDKAIEKAEEVAPVVADKALELAGKGAVAAAPVIGLERAVKAVTAIQEARSDIREAFAAKAAPQTPATPTQKPTVSADDGGAFVIDTTATDDVSLDRDSLEDVHKVRDTDSEVTASVSANASKAAAKKTKSKATKTVKKIKQSKKAPKA